MGKRAAAAAEEEPGLRKQIVWIQILVDQP
jgi:hypothetical protein